MICSRLQEPRAPQHSHSCHHRCHHYCSSRRFATLNERSAVGVLSGLAAFSSACTPGGAAAATSSKAAPAPSPKLVQQLLQLAEAELASLPPRQLRGIADAMAQLNSLKAPAAVLQVSYGCGASSMGGRVCDV